MKSQNRLLGAAAALGMVVLILDSKTALLGAAEGIDLCIRTVIPSLFPFILLSNLFTRSLSGSTLPFLGPVARCFSLPVGMEAFLIPAFLGGYPVGAQCIGKVYRDHLISRRNGEKMLSFCSNAGPAFLFGMVGRQFPEPWMVWALWGIQIVSAWVVSLVFSCDASGNGHVKLQRNGQSVMTTAVRVMGNLCGWVVIFRVLIGFLERWLLWRLDVQAQIAVMGMLELSIGCCGLGSIQSIPMRFVAASMMLSFGGICVMMQTVSVTPGLSIKYYMLGKVLQSLFSGLISVLLLGGPWLLGAAAIPLFLLFPQKIRKNSSNPLSVGV